MKTNLLVFDIDDTITKSESQHQTAYLNALKDMGMDSIDQNWVNYKNLTDSYIFKYNYEKILSKSFSPDLLQEFETHMMRHLLSLKETDEIPGAISMLQSFSSLPNYHICFATGSLIEPAFTKLKQAKIPYENEVLTAANKLYTREDIVTSSIEKSKSKYKIKEYDNIISFGDGLWDISTAANLNLHFVGLRDKNANEFKKQGVKYYINDWTDFYLPTFENIYNLK